MEVLTKTTTESLIFNNQDISYVRGKTDWNYLDIGASQQEPRADLTTSWPLPCQPSEIIPENPMMAHEKNVDLEAELLYQNSVKAVDSRLYREL